MTNVPSKNDPIVEEVGLVDWIKSEPEDASDDEAITWKSLNKKKSQPKARSKRKRKSIPKNGKPTTINRKSKRQKTKDTPASEPEIDLQPLTGDEYIIAYIKEKVEAEEEQILESSNEINSNPMTPDIAIASCASVPEIKDGCSSICISSQKVARSLTDRSLDPTQLVIHHPTCPAIVPASQLSPVTGSTQIVQLKRTPKPREEAMIPIPPPNSTYQIATSTDAQPSLRHECPECLRCFSSAATLKGHLSRGHRVVKQYVCRHCEETFLGEVYHLKHLAEAHTGKNPLSCAACQLFFTTDEATQGHLLSNVHTLPPFKCTVCGMIVPSREAQKQHCVLHRSSIIRHDNAMIRHNTTRPVTIKEWKRDTTEEILEKLRSNAGPSLDSLALKLGITANKSDDFKKKEGDEKMKMKSFGWTKG